MIRNKNESFLHDFSKISGILYTDCVKLINGLDTKIVVYICLIFKFHLGCELTNTQTDGFDENALFFFHCYLRLA